jgi:Sec-independent protein translocase protein TatA
MAASVAEFKATMDGLQKQQQQQQEQRDQQQQQTREFGCSSPDAHLQCQL